MIDMMLEKLKDTQWHNIADIEKEICLPMDLLVKQAVFLQYMELIEIKEQMLRIKSRGLKFLELPV